MEKAYFRFTDYGIEDAVRLTKELIQIDSTDPGAYETEISSYIYETLKAEREKAQLFLKEAADTQGTGCRFQSNGCGNLQSKDETGLYKINVDTVCRIQTSEVLPGRKNVMAELKGRDESLPAMVLICHMDTVVSGEDWTEESGGAFSAKETEGKIYGRGASDMKSGLAVALTAFCAVLQERVKTDRVLQSGERNGKSKNVKTDVVPGCDQTEGVNESRKKECRTECSIKFIATVDEEDFMRGAEAAIREGWVTKEDFCLDLEPTDGRIQNCHKGRAWFEVEAKGVTAHASMPQEGADAVLSMAYFITALKKRIIKLPKHPVMGETSLTFGQIEGGYRPYVVPDHAKLWIDIRTVPPTDMEVLTELLRAAMEEAEHKVPGTNLSYQITGDRPGIPPYEESALLEKLKQAVKEGTRNGAKERAKEGAEEGEEKAKEGAKRGAKERTKEGAAEDAKEREALVTMFPGYTDTAVIAGILGNKNCMSYGPGKLALAHKPNEFVEVKDIERVLCVLKQLLLSI